MNKILFILFLLFSLTCRSQPVANLTLADGTVILNAPTGRDWTMYDVQKISVYDALYDTIFIDDSEVNKITYSQNLNTSDTIAVPQQTGNCFCSWASEQGESVTIKFTNATSFIWYGEKMQHHGIAQVFLDGQLVKEVDTYSAINTRLTKNWSINNLDAQQIYEVVIKVKGTKNLKSTGTAIVIQYFEIVSAQKRAQPPVQVDTVFIEKPVYITDTLYVHTKEIVYQWDTVFVQKLDTIIVQKVDTIYKQLQPKIFIKSDSIVWEISTYE